MASQYSNADLPNPDENRGPAVLYTTWILIAISTLVVAARLWTKIRRAHRLYYDDGLMVVALLLGLAYAGSVTYAVHQGFGKHYLALDLHERNQSLRAGILTLGWGIMSPVAGRISFCVTMLYLTRTDPHVPKWPIWIFIVLQAVINITSVIVFYTQCGSQLDIFWTPTKAHMYSDHCWDPAIQTKNGYAVGAFNCLTDAFLTIVPAILIKHTKMSLKKKVGLAFLLCLSILALAAAVIKTYSMKALSEVSDYTYDLCFYVIWCSVELNVVIIVASVPLLRPLFRKRQSTIEPMAPPKWETSTLGSVFSKKAAGATTTNLSSSSRENIMPHQGQQYEMDTPYGITVTTEVSVTYQPSNAPMVHAALVGLIQGEIANPRLIQR